jgi:hypothetical protein
VTTKITIFADEKPKPTRVSIDGGDFPVERGFNVSDSDRSTRIAFDPTLFLVSGNRLHHLDGALDLQPGQWAKFYRAPGKESVTNIDKIHTYRSKKEI